MNIVSSFKNLTGFEKFLFGLSLAVVLISGILAEGQGILPTIASLIGVTALIFVAKGNVIGQILTIVFSVFYGIVSFGFTYYGEMITYLFMSAPAAALAAVEWSKHPYDGNKTEVKVKSMSKREVLFMSLLSLAVTAAFYFLLKLFGTANLVFSTISVATSFLASYLTFRRNPFYAVAYAANDVVLIVLWILASLANSGYIPMIFCFVMFLANDIYGFVNWQKMKKRQLK